MTDSPLPLNVLRPRNLLLISNSDTWFGLKPEPKHQSGFTRSIRPSCGQVPAWVAGGLPERRLPDRSSSPRLVDPALLFTDCDPVLLSLGCTPSRSLLAGQHRFVSILRTFRVRCLPEHLGFSVQKVRRNPCYPVGQLAATFSNVARLQRLVDETGCRS